MPFKSKKQMKWMFANKPKLAKKWVKKYGAYKGKGADYAGMGKVEFR